MLIDTHRIQSGRVVQSDVCIAGAGAAGITIARALSSQGISVCLLESGGLNSDEDHQSLYEGRLDGSIPPRNPSYLTRSRLRYFGGSTNHWSGWCRPLDELDFAVRSWVPDSGWPIERSELTPCYDRAAELVAIAPFNDPRDEGLEWDPDSVLLDDPSFLSKRYHFSPQYRLYVTLVFWVLTLYVVAGPILDRFFSNLILLRRPAQDILFGANQLARLGLVGTTLWLLITVMAIGLYRRSMFAVHSYSWIIGNHLWR